MEITIKANPAPKAEPTVQRYWAIRLAPARQPRTEALRRVAIGFLAEGFLIMGVLLGLWAVLWRKNR